MPTLAGLLAGPLASWVALAIAPPPSGADPATAAAAPPWVEAERSILRNHRQLTFPAQFTKAGEAYFSPDMKRLIFQAIEVPEEGEAEEFYAMFVAEIVYDGDGRIGGLSGIRRISPDGSANTCGWFHPHDPDRVLIASTLRSPIDSAPPGYQRGTGRYRWMFPPSMRIWQGDLRRLDGTGAALEPLAGDGTAYVAEGSWSPDGRSLLYCSLEVNQGDLFILDMPTGEVLHLVSAPGYDGGPFFSPDGRRICYRSDRNGNNLLQLFVAELDIDDSGRIHGVSGEFQLTDEDAVNWAPYWHPAGRHIAYASSAISHRNYEIFIVDAAAELDATPPQRRYGTARRRLTFAEGADVLPVFSPDGRFLLWTSQRGEGRSSQLWIADFVMDLAQPSAKPPSLESDRVGSRDARPAEPRGGSR
jgi:TolB protein